MLWWTVLKLKSGDLSERLQGVEELRQIEGPRAADALAHALKDRDWEVREAAAKVLISRGDPRAQAYLTEVLGTRWSAQAADLLVSIGHAAVEPLVATLVSLDRKSWQAVRVLQRIGWTPQSAHHQAMFAVVDGKYAEAAALGSVALDPLLAALKERHTAAEEIVRAIGRVRKLRCIPLLISSLGSEFGPERSAASEALKELQSLGAAAALISALKHENQRIREGAALALGEIGDAESVEPLLAALADPSHAVQAAAVFALGELRDARAIEPLISALPRSNEYLRQHIVRALGRSGDRRAAAALARVLQDKSIPVRLREKAGEALRELPGGGPLADALMGSDEALHVWASGAASQLQDPRAIELLAQGLENEEPVLREKAAEMLGELHDQRGVEPLLTAINDAEESVSKAAAGALAKIGSPAAIEPLIRTLQDPHACGRLWAATVLGELRDQRAFDALIRALQDEDPRLRARAARSVSTAGGHAAIGPLREALRDSEVSVRQAAIYALASIDDVQATESVLSALNHSDLNLRRAATKAWKRRPSANAIPALLVNLASGDDETACAAAETLEAVLERSASQAALDDLRTIEKLEDTVIARTSEGVKGSTRNYVEIECRRLKELAHSELLRRRGAARGKTV